MSRFRNSKFATKKVVAFTDADFPLLPEVKEPTTANSAIKNWSAFLSQDAQKCDERNQETDRFDGECDANGLPIYGKIKFSNGNVYRGPIYTEWPKFDEWELENEMLDEPFEYYYDPCDYYGEMVYADGTSFYGQFCFGKSVILGLVKN
jgi:hypothetical protein